MTHNLMHVLVAVGLFKAGEALTHKRRAGWLAVAVGGAVVCHRHHHKETK